MDDVERRERAVVLVLEDCSDGMYTDACLKLRAYLQKSYGGREIDLRPRGDGIASIRVQAILPPHD